MVNSLTKCAALNSKMLKSAYHTLGSEMLGFEVVHFHQTVLCHSARGGGRFLSLSFIKRLIFQYISHTFSLSHSLSPRVCVCVVLVRVHFHRFHKERHVRLQYDTIAQKSICNPETNEQTNRSYELNEHYEIIIVPLHSSIFNSTFSFPWYVCRLVCVFVLRNALSQRSNHHFLLLLLLFLLLLLVLFTTIRQTSLFLLQHSPFTRLVRNCIRRNVCLGRCRHHRHRRFVCRSSVFVLERIQDSEIQKQFSHSKSDKYGWKCLFYLFAIKGWWLL